MIHNIFETAHPFWQNSPFMPLIGTGITRDRVVPTVNGFPSPFFYAERFYVQCPDQKMYPLQYSSGTGYFMDLSLPCKTPPSNKVISAWISGSWVLLGKQR